MSADTRALPTSDELTKLFCELRHAGYPLDPRQLAAAQVLLLSAYSSGAQPDASRLKTLLAPVFVTSPAQQADFYHRFESWLNHRGLISPPEPDPNPPIDPDPGKRRRRWQLVAGCALVVILGAGTWWALHERQSPPEVAKPESLEDRPPEDGQFFFLPGSGTQK